MRAAVERRSRACAQRTKRRERYTAQRENELQQSRSRKQRWQTSTERRPLRHPSRCTECRSSHQSPRKQPLFKPRTMDNQHLRGGARYRKPAARPYGIQPTAKTSASEGREQPENANGRAAGHRRGNGDRAGYRTREPSRTILTEAIDPYRSASVFDQRRHTATRRRMLRAALRFAANRR
jgi:hypothetical protein